MVKCLLFCYLPLFVVLSFDKSSGAITSPLPLSSDIKDENTKDLNARPLGADSVPSSYITTSTTNQKIQDSSLCLPGFQCVHGVCVTETSCLCDAGWSGPLCTFPDGIPTSMIGLASTVITEGIYNEGETKLVTEGGSVVTETAAVGGSTGAISGDVDSKMCVPGFECMHGVCNMERGIHCVCDEGWDGIFCHESVGGVQVPSQEFTTQTTTTIASNTTTHPPINNNHKPLDGYGPLADISVRNCTLGFECMYGNCTEGGGYSCVCEPGFAGFMCQDPCTRFCGHGKCAVDSFPNSGPERCECDPMYTGENCTTRRVLYEGKINVSNISDDIIVVCTSAVVVLVVVMVMMLLLAYWLWRRGNILMLKLVFWFQSNEDDDGRQYDAFVSYASTTEDRQFVMRDLMPVLEEQLDFTLCIHERDFMPGKYITSNILESVRQSRRTILVISPAFVSRNWCQFEFQTAVAEMIQQKHQILPVILGDLGTIKETATTPSYDTFHQVLSTITYLHYPGHDASKQELEQFWKRLELSMPKKREKSNTPASTSTTSSESHHPHHQQTQQPKSSVIMTSSKQTDNEAKSCIVISPTNHSSHRNNNVFTWLWRKTFKRGNYDTKGSTCTQIESGNDDSCFDVCLGDFKHHRNGTGHPHSGDMPDGIKDYVRSNGELSQKLSPDDHKFRSEIILDKEWAWPTTDVIMEQTC